MEDLDEMMGLCGLGADPMFIFPVGSNPSAPQTDYAGRTPSGGASPSDVTAWTNAITGGAASIANTINTIRGRNPVPPPVQPSGSSKMLLYGLGALAVVGIGFMAMGGRKKR